MLVGTYRGAIKVLPLRFHSLRLLKRTAIGIVQCREFSGGVVEDPDTAPKDPRSHLPLVPWEGKDRLLFKGQQEVRESSAPC
jgi:hypothetical protein